MAPGPEPRPRPGTELLYGVHPVAEALGARRRTLVRLWVRRGRRGPQAGRLRSRAERLGLPVLEVGEEELRGLAPPEANTQGVLLEAGPLPALSLEELLGGVAPGPGGAGGAGGAALLVALDQVQDPQNVGAVARAAEAAGAFGLLVAERRAAPLSPAASRASAGALEVLPVARVANLGRALEQLQGRAWWVLGADPEAPADLYELPDAAFAGQVCLVLGAEGRGLRPGVRRRVDHLLRVPMGGRLASLNVAATAAILCFEWVRRTRRAGAAGTAAGTRKKSRPPGG